MTSPFLSKYNPAAMLQQKAPSQAVAKTGAPMAVSTQTPRKNFNPFLGAMHNDTPEFRDMYGVNRPFEKPMFLGYYRDQPLYGGSRLFILY